MQNKKLTIILSYVSLPSTTAVYFERALRKNHNVVTVGPSVTPEFVKQHNIDLEIKELDIPTSLDVDFEELFATFLEHNFVPDLYLWIDSGGIWSSLINVEKLDVPTACYLIDVHLALNAHLETAKKFKYTFIAQKEYITDFKKAGVENVFWLPLGCDPEIHLKTEQKKDCEIGFVGSFVNNPRRSALLESLKEKFNVKIKRCFYEEMASEFSKSKIIFNNAVLNDLNMRVFEALSSGSFLLTDEAPKSGLTELFKSGEDLAIYQDKYISNYARFYLDNEELREKIAERGRELCLNAHTYAHRCEEIIKVATGEGKTTPTAKEWRELSIKNCTVATNEINNLKRSFVIPVLDYSPKSSYNIKTLLADLENIEGTVIVIFNSKDIAEELKDHPRIDYYSIMSHNLGVARAWNIGIDMVQTPITFILNADLHVTKKSVEDLEDALIRMPDAAWVGPQGSFNNFFTLDDHLYFDKGEFNDPIEIDAISGFFFAVKTSHFHNGILKFENKFTPCYYEEWDLGFQIKQKYLRAYIVPTTGYDHQFGGSILSMEKIKFLDKETTLDEIHNKSGQYFHKKWYSYHLEFAKQDIHEFLFSKIVIKQISDFIFSKNISEEEREKNYHLVIEQYKGSKWPYLLLGNYSLANGFKDAAKRFYEAAIKEDPEFEEAKEALKQIE